MNVGVRWRAAQRVHGLLETGVEIPGVAVVQLLLQRTHFGHQRVAVVVGEAGGDIGVAGQQRLGIGDTGADIAEHVVTLVEDGLLRQQPHRDVRRWPCVPVRRLLEPGHHPQQRLIFLHRWGRRRRSWRRAGTTG